MVCDGESTLISILQIHASLGLGEFISPRWRFISFADSHFRVGRPPGDVLQSPRANVTMYSTGRQRYRTFIQGTGDGYMSLDYSTILRATIIPCITEICAELLLARWAPHFDYNSPAGNFWVVAGSNDPWRCGLASPSMGSWINSAGVLPHFAEDDPSLEALEGGRTVRQWIT